MGMIKCIECGHTISERAKKCPKCGCPVEKDIEKKMCPECGQSVNKDLDKCSYCGYPFDLVQSIDDTNSSVNKVCPECGQSVNKDLNKCSYCGYPFDLVQSVDDANSSENKVCPECGQSVNKDLNKCSYCGYPFDLVQSVGDANSSINKVCPECRQSVNKDLDKCSYCGYPFNLVQSVDDANSSVNKVCPECGKSFDDKCDVCPHCGCFYSYQHISQFENVELNKANIESSEPKQEHQSTTDIRKTLLKRNKTTIISLSMLTILIVVGGLLYYFLVNHSEKNDWNKFGLKGSACVLRVIISTQYGDNTELVRNEKKYYFSVNGYLEKEEIDYTYHWGYRQYVKGKIVEEKDFNGITYHYTYENPLIGISEDNREYHYDKEGRLIFSVLYGDSTVYRYDDEGFLKETEVLNFQGLDGCEIQTYSNPLHVDGITKVDEYGNWIERKYEYEGEGGMIYVTENREIEYYSESSQVGNYGEAISEVSIEEYPSQLPQNRKEALDILNLVLINSYKVEEDCESEYAIPVRIEGNAEIVGIQRKGYKDGYFPFTIYRLRQIANHWQIVNEKTINENEMDGQVLIFSAKRFGLADENMPELVRINNKDYFYFIYRIAELGNGCAGCGYLRLCLYNLDSHDVLSLNYAVYGEINELLKGEFVDLEKLESYPDENRFLQKKATELTCIYRPSEEDLDMDNPKNSVKRWLLDNPGKYEPQNTTIKYTYYNTSIFDWDNYNDEKENRIENDSFIVVHDWRGSVYAYDKEKKRYFVIYGIEINGGARKVSWDNRASDVVVIDTDWCGMRINLLSGKMELLE